MPDVLAFPWRVALVLDFWAYPYSVGPGDGPRKWGEPRQFCREKYLPRCGEIPHMTCQPCYARRRAVEEAAPMPAYFDADISGDGSSALLSNQVVYMVVHMITPSAGVRELESGSPDHVLRAGWVAFGDTLNVIGGVSRAYWRPPIFLDFNDLLWTPIPSAQPGTAFEMQATLLRWHIPVSGLYHAYVFGL